MSAGKINASPASRRCRRILLRLRNLGWRQVRMRSRLGDEMKSRVWLTSRAVRGSRLPAPDGPTHQRHPRSARNDHRESRALFSSLPWSFTTANSRASAPATTRKTGSVWLARLERQLPIPGEVGVARRRVSWARPQARRTAGVDGGSGAVRRMRGVAPRGPGCVTTAPARSRGARNRTRRSDQCPRKTRMSHS